MIKEIRYLSNRNIDKKRWDDTVSKAPNGFIYCRSLFLDSLCEWDALVADDYEFIMPLPYRSKMGISYIYTPFFIGQLGIVSRHEIADTIANRFLETIPPRFRYIDLHLNEGNSIIEHANTGIGLRDNYVLPLNDTYHLIENNFTKDAKKNLRQASEHALQAEENIDISIVVTFFRQAYGKLNPAISKDNYKNFEAACRQAIASGLGFTIGIKNSGGEIVAVAFFGKDEKRIYYMMGAPSTTGRDSNAQHVLINEVIKKYAGTGLCLDFEGSDIPNVANFYKKFSPQKKQYPHIRINRLPVGLKWLKK